MLGGGWVAGAGPLSRSFDLRKIVIDTEVLSLADRTRGAAQDKEATPHPPGLGSRIGSL